MKKVVSAQAMARLESRAYQEGYLEIDFMEQAGQGIACLVAQFIEKRSLQHCVLLLCGKGNNGGDAFVAGCHLLTLGYSVVALQLDSLSTSSPLCRQNGQRFIRSGGSLVNHWQDVGDFSVIVDGLFGTGFKGGLHEPYTSLVERANRCGRPILAIDIPSGLNGSSGKAEGAVIRATETIYLGLPKTGFFLDEGQEYVGRLQCVDFGLPASLVEQESASLQFVEMSDAVALLPVITRRRYKYQAGYVMGLAGSPGMPGAALLSSLAALRGGCGMVRLLHPDGMQSELAASPYELIKVPYDVRDVKTVVEWLQKGDAVFVGPGLGRSIEMQNLLATVLSQLDKPCVVDADALNVLAVHSFDLPSHSILTPHMGELQRLLHHKDKLIVDETLLQTCQHYVEEHQVTLVLKGAPTFIFHPAAPALVSCRGDPGMATAGSGDVLTGLLASLLAQKLNSRDAAILGVYLHGLAGEAAARERASRGVIASDLIAHFATAYLQLVNNAT